MSSVVEPKSLLKWLTKQLPSMIRTLESFVRTESPSTEKAAADACARLIAAEWHKRDVQVELIQQRRSTSEETRPCDILPPLPQSS